MLVTYPRLGHKLQVASPEKYRAPPAVWDRVVQLECDKGIMWTADPKEAVHNADVVVTDTWCVHSPCYSERRQLTPMVGSRWVRKQRRKNV